MSIYRRAQTPGGGLLRPGVLNILHGSGPSSGQALVAHPAIEAIAFTGRTKIGAAIASVAAPRVFSGIKHSGVGR